MSYRSGLLVIAAMLTACAQAGVTLEHTDAHPAGGDAKRDSSSGTDAPDIDAPTQCTPMAVNLLQNGNFEGTPLAAMWSETRYNNEPIVRTDGVAGQTPTTKAWLGGLAPATDAVTQDIVIPASATGLTFTGYYQVLTAEVGATVFDTGKAELVMTSGALIESLITLDNAHPASTWTTITHPVTAAIAGQTVRLKMSSANDILNPSSFYFDTLALTATVCQ